MSLIDLAKVYLLTAPFFLAGDFVWLNLTKEFYRRQIGYLMRTSPDWAAIVAFYLVFIAGLVILVVAPAIEKRSLIKAVLTGALFGLCTYATYDLTNMATVKNWPLIVVIVDILWGAGVTATVSAISFWLYTKLA